MIAYDIRINGTKFNIHFVINKINFISVLIGKYLWKLFCYSFFKVLHPKRKYMI